MPEDCFICKKHKSGDAFGYGVIFEDDIVYASHIGVDGEGLAYLGHVFVEVRRHVAGLGQLGEAEASAVGVLVNDLSSALRTAGAEHVYAHVYGDGVPHLHVHLISRYPGTPQEYWPLRVKEWPDAPRGDSRKIRELSSRLGEDVRSLRAARAGA